MKLEIGTPTPPLANPGLNVEVGWYTQGGSVWGIGQLEGKQLEPGDHIHVQIGIQVLQSERIPCRNGYSAPHLDLVLNK